MSLTDAELIAFGKTQRERDAAFLRYYATRVAKATERTMDIPSIIANVLTGIAGRITSGYDGDGGGRE